MMKLYLSLVMSLWSIFVFGQIKFNTTEIIMDPIYSGQKISKTITFKNLFDRPIKPTKVETPCGCLLGKISSNEVAVNAVDSVIFTFDSRGKEGYQNRILTIYFDNGLKQEINFKVFVKPPLLNYSFNSESLKLIKNKKLYQFEVTNTGDSIIYIAVLGVQIFPSGASENDVKLSINKNQLIKNEKAIITFLIKNDKSTVNNRAIDSYELSVLFKDCCGLSEYYQTLTIQKE